jgi:hypothetical protein
MRASNETIRGLYEAIRRHPWFAGLTASAILGAVFKFFLDKIILEGLRDLLYRVIGKWLGVSDVNLLVGILSYAIPLCLAVAVIGSVYRVAQYNALRPNDGGDTGETTAPDHRLRLAKLRTEGVEIRNKGQTLKSDLPRWIAESQQWMRKTVDAIREVDPADAEWFETLDAVPKPRVFMRPIDDEHAMEHFTAFSNHDFWLKKLEDLYQRYSASK